MICTELWNGQGLGNMLHSYVMCRTLALDKGTKFGIMGRERFKGTHFMSLDFGETIFGGEPSYEGGVPIKLPDTIDNYLCEKRVNNSQGVDIRDYDWEGILHMKDSTKIEGLWQGEKYYEHRLDEIREWLKVEPLDMPDDLCVIGFRGGEYVGVHDLFLPQSYWDQAIKIMRDKYPGIKFEVHTDDVETARRFFPEFPCIHDIALNWRSIRYAKHLIIANSSFYIFPALLGYPQEVIAPMYWAGYNVGYWKLNQNQYKKFTYI